MTTFPDFSTAPLRDTAADTDTAASVDDGIAADAHWETPEGIDVKRVYTKADRDGVETGTAATDDGAEVTPFPLDTADLPDFLQLTFQFLDPLDIGFQVLSACAGACS